jgi:hypothetical protein
MLNIVMDTNSNLKQNTNIYIYECMKANKRLKEKRNLFLPQGSLKRSSDKHSLHRSKKEQLPTIKDLGHHGPSQTDKKRMNKLLQFYAFRIVVGQDQRLHRGNQRTTISIIFQSFRW